MAGPSLPSRSANPRSRITLCPIVLAGALDHQITVIPGPLPPLPMLLPTAGLSFSPSFKVQPQHHPLFGLPFLATDYCGLQPGPIALLGPYPPSLRGYRPFSLLLPGPCPCSVTSINVTPSRYVCTCVCVHACTHAHTHTEHNSLAKEQLGTLS